MDNDKDLEVVLSDQVKQQMAADPELATAMKSFLEVVHTANEGLQSGKYDSFEDAIFALTGERPEPVDLDATEDPLEGIFDELFPNADSE